MNDNIPSSNRQWKCGTF